MVKKAEKLTPMMQQYLEIKKENPDCLLFFRLGDFYELFFEDAVTASKELDIVLTGKDCGMEERAPMCGVPFHSVDSYLNKLIEKGYRVAICEQLSEPKAGKGIVERGVTRIVSSGTIIEENMLDEQRNNYIMAIAWFEDKIGISYADITTGEFHLGEIANEELYDVMAQIQPAEIIATESIAEKIRRERQSSLLITKYPDWAFQEETARKNLLMHFKTANLRGFGCEEQEAGISAGGALLAYLNETQKNALTHINQIVLYQMHQYMVIDHVTRRNLELTAPMNGTNKKATLFGLMNKTKTPLGARLLRKWIEQPLTNTIEINERLDAVGELNDDTILLDVLSEILTDIYDLERICGRIAYENVNARDALALKKSLYQIPALKKELSKTKSGVLQGIHQEMDTMKEVYQLLERAIDPEPSLGIKEGGIIREGFNEQIDRFRKATTNAKEWLNDLEEKERQATGIKNLKIRYNKVFGYYIEITKSNLSQVPFRYQRKQTLANAERYITQELKELEDQVLGSQEKLMAMEYMIFCEIRTILQEQIPRIQKLANQVATIDVLQSLSVVARENHYARPHFNGTDELIIEEGRHPVVEIMQSDPFISNDTKINETDQQLLVITGPNMAGKSTYMRQVALIAFMAHIGSYVPAKKASIPIIDRIFTRVGASDDLASGQSTFMMEMSETANILRNATNNSLIVMDEIGRGTSTFDGLSIAWAVCEHLAERCKAKTLFATHYHELSELEGMLQGVVNYHITIKEVGDDIVFLRKIARGGADRSFGIHVAQLAGIPQSIISRAKILLDQLEEKKTATFMEQVSQEASNISMQEEMKKNLLQEELCKINVNTLTPLEALVEMNRLCQMAQEDKK